MSDYLPPVVIEVEGREDKLTQSLNRAKAQVRAFVAEVGRLNATIKVDAKLKDGALAEVRRRVEAGPAAKLKVDLQLGAGQRDQLRAQLEGRPIQATVKPVMDQSALRRVQVVLRELGRRIDVPVRLQMDGASQRRVQSRLDRLSQNRTVTIRTRVVGDTNRLPGNGRDESTGGGGGALGALMTLAPALTPIAAEATVVAAAVGAATVAVGAFGAAVKPQLSSLSGLADAQGKVADASAKYGATSKQAAQAQQELSRTLDAMPAQTRQAAGGFLVLKQDFTNWSNSLAKFTMVPVTQGIGVLDALLPKLSPLVKDTSAQFTRLTTLLAAGVSSGAFDGLMARFTAFANGALKTATDGVIHFARVLSQGGGNNTFSQFMAYAKANAPLVKETLKNLSEAILNILKAASQAGPGMLSLVNTFARLVAALPPSVIATLMQVAAAMKLIGLARTGITAVAEPLQNVIARLTALRAASAAAGGGLAGLRAAFASLSTTAKASIVIGGLALVALGIKKLADGAKEAPPDVDKLTASLKQLASSGRFTGELTKTFGSMDGLIAKVKELNSETKRASDYGGPLGFRIPGLDDLADKVANSIRSMSKGKDGLDALKGDFNSLDKSLAGMASSGYADAAAKDFDRMSAALKGAGYSTKDIAKLFPQYSAAVADANWQQQQAAASMGLFGQQAQKTQRALDAQKASADGLRQSLQALNDVNRSALDGQIGFQAAIDAATQAAKDNGQALSMRNGQLNLTTEKARNEAQALSDLASKTDDAASAARDSGSSWATVNGIYDEGRRKLIAVAQQMGLTKAQAQALASQILQTPNKTARVQMNTEDATRDLDAFNAALKRAPGSKSVTLKTLSATAEQVLKDFGYKVTHLKNGSVKVSAQTGQALGAIRDVAGAIASLHSKTVTLVANYVVTGSGAAQVAYSRYGGHQFAGNAAGGLVRGYAAGGGDLQVFPNGGYVQGPGTSTSDSILGLMGSGAMARVSNTEYVVRAAAVKKYGVGLLDALNNERLKVAGFAGGGLTQAARDARATLGGNAGVSWFGRYAGYSLTSTDKALATPQDLGSLVQSLNDLNGQIKAAFSGRTESSLLKQLTNAGKSLINYDKKLYKVTVSLDAARAKLDDLKNSAAQLKDSVSSSIMQGAGVVTQAPQEGFALTGQDVLNNLASQVSKAQTFSAQLQELKKRGLSGDLLQQIAAAGVDQGGATAAALVGASDGTIKQLNSLQGQLKKSADAAGSAVADSMYGAGIRAAQGLVDGLEKQQKSIEAAMLRIANSMQAAIKKALGIRSPSTVMAKLGDFTALGYAHGINRSSKHALIAAQGMAMSVRQGATLTGTPTLAGVSLTGGRSGGVVVYNTLHLEVKGHVMTERNLRDVVEQSMLRLGMRNSTTYAQYKR